MFVGLVVAVIALAAAVAPGGAVPGAALPTVGKVVATIHVSGSPKGLLVTPGAVWVGAHRVGLVARINPATNKVTAKINVGRNGGLPSELLYTGRRVIDVNYNIGSIAFINPKTNTAKVMTVRFENCCVPVLAAGSLWLLGLSSPVAPAPDRLSRVDPRTGRVTATRTIANVDGLVYGAGSLWASSNGQLLRLDPSSGKTLGQFPSQAHPSLFADGSLWAVENDEIKDTSTIVRIDPTSGSVVATVALPNLAWNLRAASDGTIWVGEHSGLSHPHLWTIDPTTNTLAGQVDLGNVKSVTDEDVTIAPDGTVWVALFDADVVMRIKPS
jgi:DNA-binding beta-propeller fold protein YncE